MGIWSIRTKLRELARRRFDSQNRKRLLNQDPSILSNNCVGGVISHNLGLRFNSPTVNLYIPAEDFIKFLENLDFYLKQDLIEKHRPDISYPVGVLQDIEIHFVHYESFDAAKAKWLERCRRLNMDNLYVILVCRDGYTMEMISRFDRLSYAHKVALVPFPMPEISCAVYIESFPKDGQEVGNILTWTSKLSAKRYVDLWDYVSFLNKK